MAWRQSGNGSDPDPQRRSVPPERAVELTPPGSAERSRSDLTGYNMEREEEPGAREGRFHRAAKLRLLTGPLTAEPRPLQGREGELERWGGGWHGEQPWERTAAQAAEAQMGEDALERGFEPDFVANELTRESFRASFAARERTERMAAQERRMVDVYRRGGHQWPARGRGAAGHTFTAGARGLREEGAVSPRPGRWEREAPTAQEIMTRSPRTVRRESPLSEAARLMRDENVGVVPVVDGEGRLVGLLTDRDLVVRAFTEQRSPQQFHVRDVMTEEVSAVTPETSVVEVIHLMGREQVRRVPVVDREDRLVGIIAMADIANRAEQDDELQRALERISARRSFWARF
ncbi:MAG TPA: CBS domain-containing protein [Aggregicoccus sp.]|nr:CBS domain-containing protein [Aggregicoccus sp.]